MRHARGDRSGRAARRTAHERATRMTRRAETPRNRTDFHGAVGVLLVTRDPPAPPAPVKGQPAVVAGNPDEGVEILIAVWDDGTITALNGHVDLGTGIR